MPKLKKWMVEARLKTHGPRPRVLGRIEKLLGISHDNAKKVLRRVVENDGTWQDTCAAVLQAIEVPTGEWPLWYVPTEVGHSVEQAERFLPTLRLVHQRSAADHRAVCERLSEFVELARALGRHADAIGQDKLIPCVEFCAETANAQHMFVPDGRYAEVAEVVECGRRLLARADAAQVPQADRKRASGHLNLQDPAGANAAWACFDGGRLDMDAYLKAAGANLRAFEELLETGHRRGAAIAAMASSLYSLFAENRDYATTWSGRLKDLGDGTPSWHRETLHWTVAAKGQRDGSRRAVLCGLREVQESAGALYAADNAQRYAATFVLMQLSPRNVPLATKKAALEALAATPLVRVRGSRVDDLRRRFDSELRKHRPRATAQ